MIKLENVVFPSPEQMEFVIEGMRNPMNSHQRSDSGVCTITLHCDFCNEDTANCEDNFKSDFVLGKNDRDLMQRLVNAGTDHRKFMRMIPVYVRITAPLYWWKEFDTYKVGTVANSCSTMHKIQAKEFTLEDFSCEQLYVRNISMLENIIKTLNDYRELYNNYDSDDSEVKERLTKKDIWWQMIQLLPSSYNQTRNVMLNYEVLTNIYKSRKNHKLDEWIEFCNWIKTLPYSELITGEKAVLRLRDVLPDYPINVMVRTYYNDEDILYGYCKWNRKELVALDHETYYIDEPITKYEIDKDCLTCWIRTEWLSSDDEDIEFLADVQEAEIRQREEKDKASIMMMA